MNFKSRLITFGLINVITILASITTIVIYDPLHIYHRQWLVKGDGDNFHKNMRLQAAGIINNYDFDSIIIGTSMLKGTSAKETSEKLGGNFVNLSMNASSTMERKYIIDYAMQRKDIKRVILTFDIGLEQHTKIHKKFPPDKYSFLYDDFIFNDLKAYWNDKSITCLVKWSQSRNCIGERRSLQKPQDWFDELYRKNAKISGIENWVTNKKGRWKRVVAPNLTRHLQNPIKSQSEYISKLNETKRVIENSLLSVVGENENVRFDVVFPPYSRFLYAIWLKKNPYKYQLYLDTIRYLTVKGEKLHNLTIFSFDDLPYIENLNNYSDMRHYNTDMNTMMIDLISQGQGVVNSNNIEEFIKTISQKSQYYKFDDELSYLLNSFEEH